MADQIQIFERPVKCKDRLNNFCKYEARNENELLSHINIHVHDLNFRIKCLVCSQIFNLLKNYHRHKKICVKKISEQTTDEKKFTGNFWKCTSSFCDEKIEISDCASTCSVFEKVTKHLKKDSIRGKKVTCPVKICGISYTKYNSFTKHIKWHELGGESDKKIDTIKDNIPPVTQDSVATNLDSDTNLDDALDDTIADLGYFVQKLHPFQKSSN